MKIYKREDFVLELWLTATLFYNYVCIRVPKCICVQSGAHSFLKECLIFLELGYLEQAVMNCHIAAGNSNT